MAASDRGPTTASVIVPVFNGSATLASCLDALGSQTVDHQEYEVIVIDDGSTDESAQIAFEHGVTVLEQEHKGPAAARNLGARHARGAVLLFTDADCQPQPNWIEQMLLAFADPEVVGAKGVYGTQQTSLVARFAQAEYEEKYDRLARQEQIDFIDTHAAAYRRDVFWAHDGFDPDFIYDEDQEFSFRLAQAGHKLVFLPMAKVYHQHPATVWRYARRKVQLGRWKVRVHRQHPAKAVRDSYTPWTQKAQIILVPLSGGLAIASALALVPRGIVFAMVAMGLVSTLPLMARASRQGWQVAMLAPGLALVRALALVLGLGWGMIGQLKPN